MVGNVKLHQLCVQRIEPPRNLSPSAAFRYGSLTGIGIDQTAHKAQLLDTSFQFSRTIARMIFGPWGNASKSPENVRERFHLLRDDVLVSSYYQPPASDARCAHLVGAGRDQLHISSGFFELGQDGSFRRIPRVQRLDESPRWLRRFRDRGPPPRRCEINSCFKTYNLSGAVTCPWASITIHSPIDLML